MATVQERTRPPSPPRYDAQVEARLARARQRIRMLDLAVAGLGLAAGTLAYGLVVAALDRWLELSSLTRQLAFAGYALAAAAYLALVLYRPLVRRINPYYAALQVEKTLPEAKNSVVNWLDLREQDLPPAIRGAVSQRAARALGQADLEQAISGRRAAWLSGVTGALVLVLFVLLIVFGPGQFLSLLGRTFSPFTSGGIATRTRLAIVRPEGGHATVPAGHAVTIAVVVEGRVPDPRKADALRLLFRHQPTDPYDSRPLELQTDREWAVTLHVNEVQNGFWYRVVGGDFETEEYRIEVRSSPLVREYEATYRYRLYLNWRDDTRRDPNLKAMRGTEVTLVARTNVVVQDGKMELSKSKKEIRGQLVENDPRALRFPGLELEQDDSYRLYFRSSEGESNEPKTYEITVIPDYPPQVKLNKPEEDEVALPVNGMLQVEGSASDDLGVKSLALRMQVVDGPVLQAKVYREGKSFQLSDGGYPRMLEYRDAVVLGQVKGEKGAPVMLQLGMVLEYWLEAADACDFPAPNVAQSKPRKRVKLVGPEMNPQKQEQERRQAADEQKQHERKQDDKIKEEDKQRQKEAGAQKQPNEGAKTEDQPKDPERAKQEDKLREEAKQLQRELDSREGEGKGQNQPQQKGAAKNEGRPEAQPGQGQGDSKPEGQRDPQQQPGQKKPEGGQQGQPDKTQTKGPGQQGSNTGGQPAGEARGERQPAPPSGSKDAGNQTAADRGREGEPRNAGQQPNEPTAQGQPKGAPPEQGADAARSENKGADQRAAGQQRQRDQAAARDAKREDVQQLAKELQSGDPKQQQRAAKQLDQVSRNAGSPEARDAARQALDQAGKLPGKEAKPQDVARQEKQLQSGDPGAKQEATENLDQIKQNAQDPQARQAAREALERAEKRPGESAKPGDVTEKAKDLASGDEKKRQQAAEDLDSMSRNAREQHVREAANKELEKAGARPGQDAKPEDVAEQAKDLQQGDPKQQRDALDKLQQFLRNAKEEKTREEARKALEQAAEQKRNEHSPAVAKKLSENEGPPAAAEKKGPPGQQEQQAGADKGSNPDQKEGDRGERKDQGQPTADAREPGESRDQGQPGEGGGLRTPGSAEGRDDFPVRSPEDPAGGPGDPRHRQRGGSLQLEDFNQIDKKVLDNMGWDEQKLAEFRKHYEEMLKRQPPPGASEDERVLGPQRGGSLPNVKVQPVKPAAGKVGEARTGIRAEPPPEYRDAYREFTRKLQELDRK